VRQFSPAVIIDVIALRPSLPCTAADHPGAWCEWIMWTTQVHNCPRWSTPLVWPRRACMGTRISPVTFDVCTMWCGHWSWTDGLTITWISCCCSSHVIHAVSSHYSE